MNKIEIDQRLALAIGYPADRVRIRKEHWSSQPWLEVLNHASISLSLYYGWRRFDHTDPAVIWPIAERFKAFPMDRHGSDDYFATVGYVTHLYVINKNPATATALAVIQFVESKA